jgi:acyl-CoA thioester hydrolase
MMNKTAAGPRAQEPSTLPHRHRVRVYYEDTDAGGIVYYANYLKFAERARTEMLRDAGFGHGDLLGGHGLLLAVRHCTADYLRPARLDDELDIETVVCGLGAATVELDQSITRRGQKICRVKVKVACIGHDGRPVRLPADFRRRLSPENSILQEK